VRFTTRKALVRYADPIHHTPCIHFAYYVLPIYDPSHALWHRIRAYRFHHSIWHMTWLTHISDFLFMYCLSSLASSLALWLNALHLKGHWCGFQVWILLRERSQLLCRSDQHVGRRRLVLIISIEILQCRHCRFLTMPTYLTCFDSALKLELVHFGSFHSSTSLIDYKLILGSYSKKGWPVVLVTLCSMLHPVALSMLVCSAGHPEIHRRMRTGRSWRKASSVRACK